MMFYGQCNKCGKRWELGTVPTCVCPSDEDDIGKALKRAIERINELEAELAEQARLNGMGSSREARLMAENERRSDALQKLWKERDELRALNAELVEALKHAAECVQSNYLPDKCGHDWDNVIAKAEQSK